MAWTLGDNYNHLSTHAQLAPEIILAFRDFACDFHAFFLYNLTRGKNKKLQINIKNKLEMWQLIWQVWRTSEGQKTEKLYLKVTKFCHWRQWLVYSDHPMSHKTDWLTDVGVSYLWRKGRRCPWGRQMTSWCQQWRQLCLCRRPPVS